MGSLSFYEIKEGMTLSLWAENEQRSVELPLKLSNLTAAERMEIENRVRLPHIALDVVLKEWKKKLMVVSFQERKAKLSLLVLDTAMVYKFSPVYITLIELKNGKKVHLLVSKNEHGVKHNRRRGIRIGMNYDMVAYQDEDRLNVYVNDLSYCGVGIVETENNMIDMDRNLVIWMVDPNNHKQIGHIPVKPVRRAKLDNGKNITGCVIDSRYHGIMQKYIAGRQMERVQRYASIEGVKRFEEHVDWKESIAYQFRTNRPN